jgi:hypothetical protein
MAISKVASSGGKFFIDSNSININKFEARNTNFEIISKLSNDKCQKNHQSPTPNY